MGMIRWSLPLLCMSLLR